MLLTISPPHRAMLALICASASLLLETIPAVAQTCTASIWAISYGSSVDVLPGAAIDTTGTWTVSCTGTAGRTIRICANIGRRTPNAPGGDPYRLMQGAATGTTINHELYSDPSRSSVWGSWDPPRYANGGVQIDVPLGSAGSGSANYPIYARLLANQQTARPDTYTMTLSGGAHSYSYQYVSTTSSATPACPFTPWVSYASSTITATIPGLCYMNVDAINFGNHPSGFTSALAANGAIIPQCSNTLAYTISLGGGLSGATDPTQRKLAQGAKQVTYGLYRDNAFTLPWGATAGVNTVSGTGSGAAQSITVYGRLPVQSVPAMGLYADSVVVTVTY